MLSEVLALALRSAAVKVPTFLLGRLPLLTLKAFLAWSALSILIYVVFPSFWQAQPVAISPSAARYLICTKVMLPLVLDEVTYTHAPLTMLSMMVALVDADSRTRILSCV